MRVRALQQIMSTCSKVIRFSTPLKKQPTTMAATTLVLPLPAAGRRLAYWYCIVAALLASVAAAAQDVDLDKLLAEESAKQEAPKSDLVIATFKTTRIGNGHSVEVLPTGVLDFKINHRFGTLNSGAKQFFGLDQAMIRLGLDYGITDRWMVGLGRASFQKQVDGFMKYQLLRQRPHGMPVTLAATASIMLRTDDIGAGLPYTPNYTDRLSYAFQLAVARKFSDAVSLQLMPTMVHYNIVPVSSIPNDLFSLGAGGRIKLTKSTAFTFEYYYNLPGYRLPDTKNSISMGFDIETGGHVFQLVFTNGQGIAERPFITETTGDFFKGDIHFGFNVSRVFQLGGRRKQADNRK